MSGEAASSKVAKKKVVISGKPKATPNKASPRMMRREFQAKGRNERLKGRQKNVVEDGDLSGGFEV